MTREGVLALHTNLYTNAQMTRGKEGSNRRELRSITTGKIIRFKVTMHEVERNDR